MITETETDLSAKDRLTSFYLLASLNNKFRATTSIFLFLNDLRPNLQTFRELLSPGEQALILLAFYFYTGRDIFSISLLDIFDNLKEKYI